jgi:hypothetical protein
LITFEQILANPTGVKVPSEPSNIFALGSGISSKINQANAAQVMSFISRLPAEFQVLIMKDSFRACAKIQEVPEVKQWLAATANKLM